MELQFWKRRPKRLSWRLKRTVSSVSRPSRKEMAMAIARSLKTLRWKTQRS